MSDLDGAAQQAISPSSSERSYSMSKRAKTGCITCRLRKKRCDEGKPVCATCSRLGIECMGYGVKRPEWLRNDYNAKRAKQDIRRTIHYTRRIMKAQDTYESDERHNGSTLRSASLTPEAKKLVHGEESPSPLDIDRQPSPESGIDNVSEWRRLMVESTTSHHWQPQDGTSLPYTNELEDFWNTLCAQLTGATPQSLSVANSPPLQQAFLSLLSPSPAPSIPSAGPDLTYLHHYVHVVLPLQYRFDKQPISDLVAPLAMANMDILNSVASLSALHMGAQRTRKPYGLLGTVSCDAGQTDKDIVAASTAHAESLDRLRRKAHEGVISEDVIIPTLFAVSFVCFTGGTSKEWRELCATSQRLLAAALARSPGGFGEGPLGAMNDPTSPWQRYRPLLSAMIWIDILASVSTNEGSRLLPTYRILLGAAPPEHCYLSMEHLMGCDNLTLLALAEIAQLSEWKESAETEGRLSISELMRRAGRVERLVRRQDWEDEAVPPVPPIQIDGDMSAASLAILGDVFRSATRVYLAIVVNGPYPNVLEVAQAVQDTTEALQRLDLQHSDANINRALVLPITLAGCHCHTSAQQAFFRRRFQHLGPDAAAFGNSSQALKLMEEVWKRRDAGGRGTRVCWRQTMRDMGWESGVLLI